jgi:phosphoglycolate phosphatase-like HAD superfamily hydrolase
MTARLIIFDIDGTLTETAKLDEECFVRALADVYGFDKIDTDWSRYRHSTDAGVFHEIYEGRTGRTPSMDDLSTFRRHFVGLIGAAACQSPFGAIKGARELLSMLSCGAEHRVALATGAWSDSARIKMGNAHMWPYDDFPAASSDDAPDRETILELSRQRAIERYGDCGAAVYVGDGVWDARASRKLGIPFIGIGTGERAVRLESEGAICVLPDFQNAELFLSACRSVEK